MDKLLILEDSVIQGLLFRADILNEFPFLKSFAEHTPKPRAGCRPCQRKQAGASNYNTIKIALAGLPDDRKIKLKQLLGTEQLRLYYVDGQKRRIKLTF